MTRFLVACAALLFCAAAALGEPNGEPIVPKPRGFVTDTMGILRADTVAQLNGAISRLQGETGAEIAILVVPSTEPLTIFDYAMKVAETWKVGSEADDGVLFVVAIEDRRVYLLTGYGIEGALPDGRIGEIRDTLITPAFRRGDYDGGILAATQELIRIIAVERGTEGGRRRSARLWERVDPLLVALVFVVVAAFLSQLRRQARFHGTATGAFDATSLWHNSSRRSFGGFGGFGGGFGDGGGGGFGGFGGGDFGGGGAGGDW